MVNNKQLLIENTLWVYLAKIFVQVITLLASILVLRKLSVDVYGTYVFLFGLFAVFQLIVTSPLRHVLLRFIPELKESVSQRSIRQLLAFSLSLAMLIVGIMIALTYMLRDEVAAFFNIDNFQQHISFFLIFILTYAIKNLGEIALTSLLLHKSMAILNIVLALFRSAAYIIWLKHLSVNHLLAIESCVSVLYAGSVSFVIMRHLKNDQKKLSRKMDHVHIQRMKRFWMYSVFTEFGAGIIGRTSDTYIVAAMSNPYYVGIYGFAVKIYEMCYKLLPMREFESVVKPVFFKKYSHASSDEELNGVYNYSIKVLLPVFILPFLYFFLFGQPLISSIFGDKYIGAYWVTVLVLFGLFSNGVFYPLIMLIQLKEKLGIVLVSRVVVVLSLALGVYLMDRIGVVGVALATVIGELVKNVFMFIVFRRYCKINYEHSIFKSYAALVLSAMLLFVPVRMFLDSQLVWIVASICFLAYYAWFILNFHPLSSAEVQLFMSTCTSNKKLAVIFSKLQLIVPKLLINKRNNE